MMKEVCVLIFLTCALLATGQKKTGIQFFEGALEAAQKKAKTENKWVFLDCYTSWCGPCRYMADQVFTTQAVGDFMNEQFICVKMDMEKGEGPAWRRRLNIGAYPTFILFTPDRQEQHRITGSAGPDEFIRKIKAGMKPETSTSYMNERYQQGERSPEFLKDYLRQLYEFRKDSMAKAVIAEIHRSIPDRVLQSPSYWWLFTSKESCPFGSETFDYLVRHQERFIQSRGDTVNQLILQKVENAIDTYIGWYPLKGDYDPSYYKTVCCIDDFVKENMTAYSLLMAETELFKARFCGSFKEYMRVFQKNIWQIPTRNVPNAYSGLAFCALKTGDQEKVKAVIQLGQEVKTKLTDTRLQAIMDRVFAKIKEEADKVSCW